MAKSFTLDGWEYKIDDLSAECEAMWNNVFFTLRSLDELKAKRAIMTRAKNAYIEDLKVELIEKKSGIDFGALFTEE